MIVPEPKPNITRYLESTRVFREQVTQALASVKVSEALGDFSLAGTKGVSVVLLPIGVDRSSSETAPEPCLILNKRSQRVRQPGDICCPGGGIEPRIDRILARMLRLPGSPLRRWPCYAQWQGEHPEELRQLHLLMATALREGLEEMRLNPLAVRFLGSLPPEPLVMFRRMIHPLVVWVGGQQRFYPNWEVERVIKVPVRMLLNPTHYRCYRLSMPATSPAMKSGGRLDFPAFRLATLQGTEFLWGATFRIAMRFLNQVLGFTPPATETLEVVERELTPQYMTGDGRRK